GEIGRRDLLKSLVGALSLGAVGGFPGRGLAASPWADGPSTKVDRLNFVVWTYGDIYTKIAKKFTDDWGVQVDSTISSFNEHPPPKLMTMYAVNEAIDVSQSSPYSFRNFISQALVDPLGDLPGAKDYLADFPESARQVAVWDGKLMGLPYFSTVWVWNYYSDL